MSGLPRTIRIGHLTYTLVQDDNLVRESAVRAGADLAGCSSQVRQTIAIAAQHEGKPVGEQYQRETVLHEILHCCLAVTGTSPDDDGKAGLADVEERAVNAMAGPLLAVLTDHPELVAWLVDRGTR